MPRLKMLQVAVVVVAGACSGENDSLSLAPDHRENEPLDPRSMSSGYRSDVEDWVAFLSCWADKLSALAPQQGGSYRAAWKEFRSSQSADRIERALAAAESRLQTRLPASYRHFILAGGAQFALGIDPSLGEEPRSDFRTPEDVHLFRVAEAVAFVDWSEARPRVVADDVYYQYGFDSNGISLQDPVMYGTEQLESAILVGEWPGDAYLLLIPAVVFEDGEWEAWWLSWRDAGAIRFRSFAELMQNIAVVETEDPPHGGPFPGSVIVPSCADLLTTALNSDG